MFPALSDSGVLPANTPRDSSARTRKLEFRTGPARLPGKQAGEPAEATWYAALYRKLRGDLRLRLAVLIWRQDYVEIEFRHFVSQPDDQLVEIWVERLRRRGPHLGTIEHRMTRRAYLNRQTPAV